MESLFKVECEKCLTMHDPPYTNVPGVLFDTFVVLSAVGGGTTGSRVKFISHRHDILLLDWIDKIT